jgi:SM-20-related protein
MTLRHESPGSEVERLGVTGFFVREHFLGHELARAVRREAEAVTLRPAAIRRSRVLDPQVRSDDIAWLTAEEASGALRAAVIAFERLRDEVNQSAWLGLRGFDLQLARYAPGARYVKHRDAFPGQDNRRLTAIVYLNEGWQPEHGGELELCVEPPQRVQPTLDRLVVFRSELIEHQVLEAHAERWALTAWYSAR